jgi:hypothetical protein
MQHNHWKIIGHQLPTKSHIELKDNSNNFVTKMKEKSLTCAEEIAKGFSSWFK